MLHEAFCGRHLWMVPLAGPQQEIGDADALAASGLAVDAAERIRSEWQPERNFE